ncbi:MAG: hypothetical protein IT346_01515 [Epsilonproteobacteria bacterium]|nr:hypothetical protein [Campylobacterota bacterium]
MATVTRKPIIQSNLCLKVTACIIGYSIWAALSNTSTIQQTHQLPIAFYNVPDAWQITAPDVVEVTLAAKRNLLRRLSREKLAVHIDAATLKAGDNHISIIDSSLFLPAHAEIVDYARPCIVHVDSPIA